MSGKEADELFQFLLDGAVRKLIHCMIAEGNTEAEIMKEVEEIQRIYKRENTPKGVLMSASKETLMEFVRVCQDYYEKALKNNPNIADSVCRRTDYIH